jgi:diguanylate cyclase (GGDEF)-like protein
VIAPADLYARFKLIGFGRWKLLSAFVWALLLCAAAAGFGLHGINRSIDMYAELVEPTATAAQSADAINALFLTRHKVLKDAYLFTADPPRVERAISEVAAYDQQIADSLRLLRAKPALDLVEQQMIDDLWAPLNGYGSASRAALDLVQADPDHYAAQQAAVELTYLQDRPISEALADLSRHLSGRSADEAAEVRASSRRIFAIAVAATLAALALGLMGGIAAIGADIAERKRTDEALRSGAARLLLESQRMLALHRASTVLAGQTGDPNAVFDEILSSAVTLLGASSGSLHPCLPEEGVLRAVRSKDVSERHQTPDVRPGEGMVGHTFVRRAPLVVNDYRTWEHALGPARGGNLRAGLGVPLMRSGQCLGVLMFRIYGDDPTRFTEDDARISAFFANQSAEALFRADAFERQRQAALHDALTGLPNRVLLQDRLQIAIESSAEGAARPMAVMVMDLDRFKEVNDTHGHQSGDLLLQQIGPRLRTTLRETDTLARLGGDEFAMLLPETDGESARGIAERLLHGFEAPFDVHNASVEVRGSIGIALYPDDGTDAETLLRHADMAMYLAKSDRSGWASYTPERDHYSPDRLALVADLRRAIDRNELVLYYQPQVNVRSGGFVAVEALMRWPHPERGLLAPDTFIPLAEQTQLIRPLTRWAIGAALRQSVAWQAAGLTVPVAVNLSAHDVQDAGLPQVVAELLGQYDARPEHLRLEITESSLLGDPERARATLAELRALGVRIAIDDFGTGYSSLSYLQRLPVDELKIDKSFVKSMAADEGSRSIVRAVIDMADDLGLGVVAEGVEDRATWEVLAALGCDLAQVYNFSPPLAAEDLPGWIDNLPHRGLDDTERRQADAALVTRVRERGVRLNAEAEFLARKRVESALQESEERLRLAIEAADVATWDWDLLDESSGGPLLVDVHPEDLPLVEAAVRDAVASTGELRLEHRMTLADGSHRWIARKGRVFRDPAGRAVRMLGTDVDITERKVIDQQREALAKTEKLRALGQMASGIAHDLNQSLLLIAGNGDLARQALDQPSADLTFAREALGTMTQAAIEGGETVKRLLTFGRTQPEGEPEQVNVEALLQEVAKLTAPRWRDNAQVEGRPIKLYVDAAHDATILVGIAGLRQALTNLVFNAVDALPTGGTISLGAQRASDEIVIAVADSGAGMSPEVQARIFEPFFTTKGARGTGLGLAQVFGIVERHSGRIEVESQLGVGTTFRIFLPSVAAPTLSAPVASATPMPTQKLRILAVDDEPLIGKMVERLVRTAGHVVVIATSGEQALELLHTSVFDIVISDVGMGAGMNGWELAEHVREKWPTLGFILATGWGAQIDLTEARSKGVHAVLAKPYRPEDLLTTLQRISTAAAREQLAA